MRTLNLEPFPFLEGWYRRTNPKINNLNNDYNEKFLPETQYGNFNLDFIKINFTEKYEKTNDKGFGFFRPFYLELLNEKIIIVNGDGEILYAQESDLYKKEDKNQNLITKKIKSNLTELGTWSDKKKYRVMGTLIHENKIYISHSTTIEEKCEIYHISYADINFNNLIFDNFFTSNECGHHLRAGRMQFLNYNGEDGILATIGGETVTSPTLKAQNLNSDIGKTLFIDFKNKKKTVYSYGHRNAQGLLVTKDVILSTEHGPRGGDEINKIIFGNNYGWPLVSYGHSYHGINAEKELKGQEDFFKKGHEKYNFTEPVYSFVPSVGISQIVKIPNNYHELWRDNFLLATLNGGHLQRIMFSNDFDRVIYIEKIFVNRRIRDLKFSKTSKALILALEDWQEIGILRPILDN